MDALMQVRCDTSFKESVRKRAKEMGFGTVSDYVRFTLTNDLKKNGRAKKGE